MARGPKRTQIQIITDKISKLDESITKYQSKIDELTVQKTDFEKQLIEIEEAEKKAAEEAKMKELMKFMDKYELTIEQLENMMNKPE